MPVSEVSGRPRPAASVRSGGVGSHPDLRLLRAAGRGGRDQVAGGVRGRGDPDRGSGAAGPLGHPRGIGPFVDERRGIEFGGGYNNPMSANWDHHQPAHERGKELLAGSIARSDCGDREFAAGVLERLGFGYERLQQIRPDIIYVSNCGFGQVGPYAAFKTWGPIVQAVSGLTFLSGLPGQPPAGWGYSYMDHTGANNMAMAILLR